MGGVAIVVFLFLVVGTFYALTRVSDSMFTRTSSIEQLHSGRSLKSSLSAFLLTDLWESCCKGPGSGVKDHIGSAKMIERLFRISVEYVFFSQILLMWTAHLRRDNLKRSELITFYFTFDLVFLVIPCCCVSRLIIFATLSPWSGPLFKSDYYLCFLQSFTVYATFSTKVDVRNPAHQDGLVSTRLY